MPVAIKHVSRWIRAFFGGALLTAYVVASAQAQQVHWLGDDNCEDMLAQTISEIPGGFPLKYKLSDGVAHYFLSEGGTLRLRLSQAKPIKVDGRTFEEAYRNLVRQRPLQDGTDGRRVNEVVFASVHSGYQLDLDFEQNEDLSWFVLKPGGYNVNMNSKVSVIAWSGYYQADAESRRKWDKMTCESFHHELGHILIGAQIFAEAEPMWLELRGRDEADVQNQTDNYFDLTMARVRARQASYHQQIEAMGRELADSRPYLELPFSWLD